ncbi:aldose 1-epimerase family protein [Lentisphaera profundi]|uniref:Aldose 1-epimerase family protein n=1 Tax=Lentisphaera profundi TaxID=1658616 RepID=A0ABY7VUF7_9BACT|nr:aldose 1-epimerase family protein [Lentisphaera profundi]WDE97697.1 aldose 1-epimerase family protein [Lentisphaera profundi]
MKHFLFGICALTVATSCQMHKTADSEITLSSVEKNISLSDGAYTAADFGVGATADWSVTKKTLHGGMQEGVELVTINNGEIEIDIIPTRGMNVMSVRSKDITLGWDSPVKEIVHPRNVNLNINGGLGWLDSFNEWMVRCGLEYSGHPGDDDGRLMTLHGRIAHIPASELTVKVDKLPPHRISVTGIVNEVWFKGANFTLETTISTIPGSHSFRFDDVVTNNSSQEKEFQVLYHANFAKELLEAGSRLEGTIAEVQPFNDYAAKSLDSYQVYDASAKVWADEKVYQIVPFADKNGFAHFMLHNKKADKAVSFSFNTDSLPYLTQWKNEDSLENGYVTGLEPGNTFPANRSHERKMGRLPKIKAGESINYHLEYTLHSGLNEVKKAQSKIAGLNEGRRVKYIKTPENK